MQMQNSLPFAGCYVDPRLQEFQYFVVIDFEATCDKGKRPYPQEIIEFPSVIVSSITGRLEACFRTYVRPTCNRVLTDFCKDLTGIQQSHVDGGVTLSEALLQHDQWLQTIGIKIANFAVVTWSDWDCKVMLESECRFKNIKKPSYFDRWIDLKVPFHKTFGEAKCNLKEAVEKSGLAWQGRLHCGLDDAKNAAYLLALLMYKGIKLSITSTIACKDSSRKEGRKFEHRLQPADISNRIVGKPNALSECSWQGKKIQNRIYIGQIELGL